MYIIFCRRAGLHRVPGTAFWGSTYRHDYTLDGRERTKWSVPLQGTSYCQMIAYMWTIFFPTQLNLLFVPFNCILDATNNERLILASNNAIVCYEDWEHTLMFTVAITFWFFLACLWLSL